MGYDPYKVEMAAARRELPWLLPGSIVPPVLMSILMPRVGIWPTLLFLVGLMVALVRRLVRRRADDT